MEDSTGKTQKMEDLMLYDHIDPTDFDRAAAELKSPYPFTPEIAAEGQVLYTRICTPCHGASRCWQMVLLQKCTKGLQI